MLNILTTEYKNVIQADCRQHKIVVVLVLTSILFSIGLMLAFSLYAVSGFRIGTVAINNNQILTGADLAEYTKVKQNLTTLNNKSLLIATSSPVVYTDVLEKIIKAKSAGIIVDSFAIDYVGNKKLPIGNISGFATDRQSLVNFVEALKKDKTFSSVDYPVSNIIGGNDNRFNVSLEMAKK